MIKVHRTCQHGYSRWLAASPENQTLGKALKELENESKRLDALKRKKAREEADEKVKEELEELKARMDILATEKAKAEAALHDTLIRLAQANSEVEQRK